MIMQQTQEIENRIFGRGKSSEVTNLQSKIEQMSTCMVWRNAGSAIIVNLCYNIFTNRYLGAGFFQRSKMQCIATIHLDTSHLECTTMTNQNSRVIYLQ